MALKLHQSIQLTQSEKKYWNNFSKEEKAYIITGVSQQTLDFTQYQDGYFSGENLRKFVRAKPQAQNPPIVQIEEDPDPDLFADEPPFPSSSDKSNPALRHNIDTPRIG